MPGGLYSFISSRNLLTIILWWDPSDTPEKYGWWLPKQANFESNVDPIICPDISTDFSEPSRESSAEELCEQTHKTCVCFVHFILDRHSLV